LKQFFKVVVVAVIVFPFTAWPDQNPALLETGQQFVTVGDKLGLLLVVHLASKYFF